MYLSPHLVWFLSILSAGVSIVLIQLMNRVNQFMSVRNQFMSVRIFVSVLQQNGCENKIT